MIENFNKDKNRKDGLYPQCKFCRKDFYLKIFEKILMSKIEKKRNLYLKNKRETDVIFRLISNTRNGIYKSLKGMTKQSSTKQIIGIDIDLSNKWIEFQFTPEMNWSIIEIDHVKPICMFDVSKDEKNRSIQLEKHSTIN